MSLSCSADTLQPLGPGPLRLLLSRRPTRKTLHAGASSFSFDAVESVHDEATHEDVGKDSHSETEPGMARTIVSRFPTAHKGKVSIVDADTVKTNKKTKKNSKGCPRASDD